MYIESNHLVSTYSANETRLFLSFRLHRFQRHDVSKEVDALKEAFVGATKQIQNLTGSLQSATIAAATIKIPENFQVNVDELNNRLASASVSVSQVQDVYNNIEKSLDGQPEAHRDVVSASDKLVVQLEEMNSLVKQLNEKYSAIAKAMGN